MPDLVDFNNHGYLPIAHVPANLLPQITINGKPSGAPTITLYACLRCGAMVPSVAEAGRLSHNNFHRDLDQAGVPH